VLLRCLVGHRLQALWVPAVRALPHPCGLQLSFAFTGPQRRRAERVGRQAWLGVRALVAAAAPVVATGLPVLAEPVVHWAAAVVAAAVAMVARVARAAY